MNQSATDTKPTCISDDGQYHKINDSISSIARTAALLWFFYVSPLSEATSCAEKPQDCDSCWAYYAGGSNLALRDQARGQLDRALMPAHRRVLVRGCGRAAGQGRLRADVGALSRSRGPRATPPGPTPYQAQIAAGTQLDAAATMGILDALFPCP